MIHTIVRSGQARHILHAIVIASFLIASVALADVIFGSYSSAHSNDVTYTEVQLNTPSSTATGNLLVANIAVNGGSEAIVDEVPYGWTQIRRTNNDTNVSIITYYKVATSSASETYTWKFQDQTTAEGAISRYTGVDSSDPVVTSTGNTGFGENATTSPVTTTDANQMVVSFFATDVGKAAQAPYFSTPSSLTERYDLNNAPFGPSTATFDVVQAAAGEAGIATSTINGNKSRFWVTQQIALRKASAQISVESGTNGPTSYTLCSPASSATFSKTVSATSTLLMVHVVSPFISGVTYAGNAMTLATSSASGMSTWYIVNPTSGTNNVVVSFSPNSGGYGSAVSYTGTDTSSPLGAMSVTTGSSGNPSISITTNNNNSIVDDSLFYDIGQSLTANSPQEQQVAVLCSSGGNSSHGASILRTTTAGANTLGWTHGGSDGFWIEIATEVNAGQ